MTTAPPGTSTPSPQRRLVAACCECSDDGKCSPSSSPPSSPCSPSTSRNNNHATAAPGIRFRASLPAVLAKLLSLLALATFLSAAVHDSAKSATSLRHSKLTDRAAAAAAGANNHHQHRYPPFTPPWFCHGSPCPPFDALASPSPDAYAVRRYRGPQTWARVRNISVSTYEAAYAAGWLALAAYARGDNAEGRRLNSAGVPTLVSFHATGDDFARAEDRYDVSMFLAPELGPDGETPVPPPRPSSPEVEIETVDEAGEGEGAMVAYVVQFGGFATGRASLANAARLALALERDGLPYLSRRMELAVYDPPTRLAQRHNEVWLLEEEPPSAGEEGKSSAARKVRKSRRSAGDDGGAAAAAATAFAA